ncbi:hypothetical protein [Lentilactobacillus farraginis]|uniref:hypothetical protein n=1 Tax=Lentilactobacillus farraginis TaxID=390841 RepID=UPI0005509195|nr:hypothetical protein [Lentilactobacillus farraginis]
MSNKRSINILGIQYVLHTEVKESEQPILSEYDGFTDTSTKDIYISQFIPDKRTLGNLQAYTSKIIRHELIHAFLFESGLDCNTDWARNEEIVDWIAIQFPKLKKLFSSIDIEGDC